MCYLELIGKIPPDFMILSTLLGATKKLWQSNVNTNRERKSRTQIALKKATTF